MQESGIKSVLPFVKASKTVTRDRVTESTALDLSLISDKSNVPMFEKANGVERHGFKLGDNCVAVTVRRDGVPERKNKSQWNIDLSAVKPSSLEELPPPSKLRKTFRVKPKLEKSLTKRMRRETTSNIITEHVTDLKRKQLVLSRNADIKTQSPNHQVVPPSPNVTTNLSEPTIYDFTSSLYPMKNYNILHHKTYKYNPLEGFAGEIAVEPLIGADTATETEMTFPKNTIAFLPEQSTAAISEHLGFSLPLPSPPQILDIESHSLSLRMPSPLPFNPITFGIQKLYPREE